MDLLLRYIYSPTLHIYIYVYTILGEGSIPRSYFRPGVVGNNSNIDCHTVQTEKLCPTLPDNVSFQRWKKLDPNTSYERGRRSETKKEIGREGEAEKLRGGRGWPIVGGGKGASVEGAF